MSQTSPESSGSHITPAQAADVIAFYDTFENELLHRNNWKRKVSLGQVAIHTAMRSHSILPGDEPLLSYKEAEEGLEHLQGLSQTQELGSWPVEPTAKEWEDIFKLSDRRPCPVDEAYAAIMGVKPLRWK